MVDVRSPRGRYRAVDAARSMLRGRCCAVDAARSMLRRRCCAIDAARSKGFARRAVLRHPGESRGPRLTSEDVGSGFRRGDRLPHAPPTAPFRQRFIDRAVIIRLTTHRQQRNASTIDVDGTARRAARPPRAPRPRAPRRRARARSRRPTRRAPSRRARPRARRACDHLVDPRGRDRRVQRALMRPVLAEQRARRRPRARRRARRPSRRRAPACARARRPRAARARGRRRAPRDRVARDARLAGVRRRRSAARARERRVVDREPRHARRRAVGGRAEVQAQRAAVRRGVVVLPAAGDPCVLHLDRAAPLGERVARAASSAARRRARHATTPARRQRDAGGRRAAEPRAHREVARTRRPRHVRAPPRGAARRRRARGVALAAARARRGGARRAVADAHASRSARSRRCTRSRRSRRCTAARRSSRRRGRGARARARRARASGARVDAARCTGDGSASRRGACSRRRSRGVPHRASRAATVGARALPASGSDAQTPHSYLAGRTLILVSNREPYEHVRTDGTRRRRSRRHRATPAGRPRLARSIRPCAHARHLGRVGLRHAPTARRADADGRLTVPPESPRYTLRRVWLDDADVDGYYLGFANSALWPLCHMLAPALRDAAASTGSATAR